MANVSGECEESLRKANIKIEALRLVVQKCIDAFSAPEMPRSSAAAQDLLDEIDSWGSIDEAARYNLSI